MKNSFKIGLWALPFFILISAAQAKPARAQVETRIEIKRVAILSGEDATALKTQILKAQAPGTAGEKPSLVYSSKNDTVKIDCSGVTCTVETLRGGVGGEDARILQAWLGHHSFTSSDKKFTIGCGSASKLPEPNRMQAQVMTPYCNFIYE